MLPGKVHLDFKSRDAEGKFVAPEGDLKSSVFISTRPRPVTVARGSATRVGAQLPVHGVSGMSGVGKTTVLIGIEHEEDIKEHFTHGVLYMSVGAAATVAHLTGELFNIVRVTGATTSSAEVLSSKTLADAVSHAAVWFHGKQILFLIDDIWPSTTRPEGYLPEMEGLLQGGPHSRIAISTRSLAIAAKGGSHVNFGARDPCGLNSLAIFVSHALPFSPPSNNLLESARSVLLLCAGLPISLSVAGAAIALRINSGVKFEDACLAYVENIQTEISLHPGASFLENAIRQSLAALAEDREENGRRVHEDEYSLSELYASVCILENQQFAPVPVLARMWNMSEANAENVCASFSSMSWAKISTHVLDGRKQSVLNIHDLHLEYCRRNADQSGEEIVRHRRLLNGHMNLNSALNEVGDGDDPNGALGLNMLER